MSRKAGTPNRGTRFVHRALGNGGHARWTYNGRLFTDADGARHLRISKVHGDFTGQASELDEAIKSECRWFKATGHLDDTVAADEMLKHLVLRIPQHQIDLAYEAGKTAYRRDNYAHLGPTLRPLPPRRTKNPYKNDRLALAWQRGYDGDVRRVIGD